MDHFALFDIQHQVDGNLFPSLLTHNLEQSLADAIDGLNGLELSSIFRVVKGANTPFRWLVGVDSVTRTRIGKS